MRRLSLLGWVALCFAVGGVSGAWTAGEVNGWYRTLARPWFAPPDWVFGPVWTLLYLAMGIAAWLVWRAAQSKPRTWGLGLFLLQLALNAAWTWIFFRHHAMGAALVEIGVLWAVILATLIVFRRVSVPAAWLLAPYLAWVSFASLLNAGFWRLN